ncbi:MAG: helix-turn-helix domain-containing protein [Vulcanimicrobiota bacterium]
MSLGRTISDLRKKKGLTQVELAEKLGVHQSHITRWESDRVRPRQSTLANLAEVLDCSIEELLVGGKEALASTSKTQSLSSCYRTFRSSKRKRSEP